MLRVGVIGADGRMGSRICAAIEAAEDLELVARADMTDEVRQFSEAAIDVAVDVTTAEAARENLPWLASAGIDVVVGTTGFDANDTRDFDQAFKKAGKRCFLVPNFSIGAVLMMRFAAEAAPHLDAVEIIEFHHDKKADAPSGTAALTATKISEARHQSWSLDTRDRENVTGVRGGDVDGVRVHSVRLPGLVAHQEVIFGGEGQSLSIRHDSYDRSSFMPGVLLAIRSIGKLSPGVTVGLDAVLFDNT